MTKGDKKNWINSLLGLRWPRRHQSYQISVNLWWWRRLVPALPFVLGPGAQMKRILLLLVVVLFILLKLKLSEEYMLQLAIGRCSEEGNRPLS